VIVPLRAPNGASFGFLLLGQSRGRSYSAVELFVLQALAGELSWVVRDLAARKAHHRKLAAVSHSITNDLQVVLGKAAMLRQKLKEVSSGSDNPIEDVEAAVQAILERLRALPEGSAPEPSGGESPTELSIALAQSLASCRNMARERGVTLEIVCAPDAAGGAPKISERAKGFLTALVDVVTSIARAETVRLTVQHRDKTLELIVQGMGSSQLVDKLRVLFEGASRSEAARDEKTTALARMCEYLDDVGGDVYLKGRPGEAAEFVVRLPMEGRAQGGRLSEKNDVDTKDLV
jgi:light-regulated signal transduction histidine kinase (bacteriophytochrome)